MTTKMASIKQVYEEIAQHFSDTRYNQWNCVKIFLDSLETSLFVCDIGCGNGKNMLYRRDLIYIGCDITENLLYITQEKTGGRNDLLQVSGLQLPYRSNIYDAIMSIAVLHHIPLVKDRIQFMKECIRCLQSGGRGLITVWGLEQPLKKKWVHMGNGDFMIPWDDKESGITYNRFYHFFSNEEINNFMNSFDEIIIESIDYECYNYCITFRKK
jgi:SAM-dependent methyltransferase